MNDVFNLPQGITTVGTNFCYQMFYACTGASLTMNDVFNLPQGITTVGNAFCAVMFSDCIGASFQVNDVFQLPQNFTQANVNSAFAQGFLSSSGTYRHMQNRTALSIIGSLPYPNTSNGLFRDAWTGGTVSTNNSQGKQWSDYDLIPANWK
jgi:hypothetical protein